MKYLQGMENEWMLHLTVSNLIQLPNRLLDEISIQSNKTINILLKFHFSLFFLYVTIAKKVISKVTYFLPIVCGDIVNVGQGWCSVGRLTQHVPSQYHYLQLYSESSELIMRFDPFSKQI